MSSAADRTAQVTRHLNTSNMSGLDKFNAPDLPAADAIYSHVATVPATARLVYLSGQVPAIPETGALVEGGIQPSTAQCIANLERALKVAGSSLANLVKVNIFLKNMSDFDAVNEVYTRLIPAPKPARTCVQAGKRKLPSLLDLPSLSCAQCY